MGGASVSEFAVKDVGHTQLIIYDGKSVSLEFAVKILNTAIEQNGILFKELEELKRKEKS
jgi:hypothetical protein